MKQVWAIYTVRPLVQAERIDAMLLGLRCACGAEVTHDTVRRYLGVDGRQESGMKVCGVCVARRSGR